MRLVLLGDLHTYRLAVPPWRLLGKSLFGYLNLVTRRRRHFRLELAPPTVARAASLNPDMVLLSGDLTTIALPGEFDDARHLLAPLIDHAPAVLVPGNHDRYSFSATRQRHLERAFPRETPAAYPSLRRLTPAWSLVGVDSSVPRVVSSRGRVGKPQLEALRAQLATLAPAQGVIVLCHYAIGKKPPLGPMRPGHMLEDQAELLAELAACQARVLYVHGHVHCPWRWQRTEPGLTHVTDINTGAPCLCGRGFDFGQGFLEMTLPAEASGPVAITHHVMRGEGEWMTVAME